MELFEIHAGSFIGVADATPLGVKKQIRAIDAGTQTFNYGSISTRHTDDDIGTGDGSETDFTCNNTPLVDANDLTAYVDGEEIDSSYYSVVLSTGVVTFSPIPTENTADALGTGDGTEVDFTCNNTPLLSDEDLTVYVDAVEYPKTGYSVVLATGVVTFAPVETIHTDDDIGTGDGIEVDFTCNNIPLLSGASQTTYPVGDTGLTVFVDGVKVSSADYSVVLATGVITFDVAPLDTLAITATYTSNDVAVANGLDVTADYISLEPIADTLAVTADYLSADVTTKAVAMLAGEAFKIGGECESVTSEALKKVILS